MAPFDRSYTTSYHFAIANIVLSCIIFEIFDVEDGDLEIKVRGHSPWKFTYDLYVTEIFRHELSFCR